MMGGGYTKRELIDSVAEALRPLTVQGGGYIKQIDTRGLDGAQGDVLDDAIQLPALFVSYSSSTYSKGQYMSVRETVGLEITVVLRSGTSPDPEMVLDDIRGILSGSTLGLEIGPVTPLRESVLSAGKHRAAFSALYSLTQAVPSVL